MIIKKMKILTLCLLLGVSSSAFSAIFWRTGEIQRILTDSTIYGGCMIMLNTSIANGCPSNGWVSLDCTETYFQGSYKNKLALVLTALATNRQVSIKIDNTKKHDGYCVAQRVLIF